MIPESSRIPSRNWMGHLKGCTKWKVFIRRREILAKEKKGLFLGQGVFFCGRGEWQGFYHTNCLFFLWGGGWKGLTWLATLLVLDQQIPDWSIKITFLGEVWTAIRSSIKSTFGIIYIYIFPPPLILFPGCRPLGIDLCVISNMRLKVPDISQHSTCNYGSWHYRRKFLHRKLHVSKSYTVWKKLLASVLSLISNKKRSINLYWLEIHLYQKKDSLSATYGWNQQDPMTPPKYRRLSMSHFLFVVEDFSLLGLPLVPKSGFRYLLIREVKECRNQGKTVKKQQFRVERVLM